jgi:hypothetical protein
MGNRVTSWVVQVLVGRVPTLWGIMATEICEKLNMATHLAAALARFKSLSIKSYLRKGLFGGDLRDVVSTLERVCEQSDRDTRLLAKQISDLTEQIRQMTIENDRIRRELAHLAVNEANLTASINGNGFRPHP